MSKPNETLADDLLIGVAEITRFLGRPQRQTQWLIESGQLPTFKLKRRICARRSELLRALTAEPPQRVA